MRSQKTNLPVPRVWGVFDVCQIVLGYAIGMRFCSPFLLVILRLQERSESSEALDFLSIACWIVVFAEYLYDQSYLAGDRRGWPSLSLRLCGGLLCTQCFDLSVILMVVTHCTVNTSFTPYSKLALSPITDSGCRLRSSGRCFCSELRCFGLFAFINKVQQKPGNLGPLMFSSLLGNFFQFQTNIQDPQ